MKNKPYPALLRPSNLSNEIGKRVPKSRETIPLTGVVDPGPDATFRNVRIFLVKNIIQSKLLVLYDLLVENVNVKSDKLLQLVPF
jgi:hypothetical protein